MTGSNCQYICAGVQGANYFSHYNEGHEAEHGYCGCFSSCAWPVQGSCHETCATHEVFSEEEGDPGEMSAALESSETFGGELDVVRAPEPRPGPRWCHCMRGPLTPDVDTCDLWP